MSRRLRYGDGGRRIAIAFAALLALQVIAPRPSAAQPTGDAAAPNIGRAGLPARIDAIVTGDPASPDFVTARIVTAVARAAAALPPGTTVTPLTIAPAPAPLERGFRTDFTVTLGIDPGDGRPTSTASTRVDVENVDVPGFTPLTLAFRDDPERIVADGVLSRTTVVPGRPTRLYYYHENTGRPRRFAVVFACNDSVLTRAHVITAAAGPNIDVMSTGHAATRTFLQRQRHAEGTLETIRGGVPLVERDETAGVGDVIVGAIDVRVISGGPLTVTVMALEPGTPPAAYLYTPKLPDDGHGRHGNFALAGFGERIVAFTAGGPDAAHTYGKRGTTPANTDPADAGHDYGDYGVLQRIAFDLANPAAQPVTVYLYEKPLGGAVRSSFLVDGRLVELGCARAAQRYAIASTILPARGTAALDVVTMTDGGSNYPLEIGVSLSPPAAVTPPIFATDGCFPKPATPTPVPRN